MYICTIPIGHNYLRGKMCVIFFHQANKAMDFLQIITIITIYLISESDDDNSHRQVISLVFILKSTKQCNDL